MAGKWHSAGGLDDDAECGGLGAASRAVVTSCVGGVREGRRGNDEWRRTAVELRMGPLAWLHHRAGAPGASRTSSMVGWVRRGEHRL